MAYDCVMLRVFDPDDNDTHVTIARTPRAASDTQFCKVLDLIHDHRGRIFHLLAAHAPGEGGRVYRFDLIAGEAFDLIRTGLHDIFKGTTTTPRDGPLQAHSARGVPAVMALRHAPAAPPAATAAFATGRLVFSFRVLGLAAMWPNVVYSAAC
jgi:hypothetical protein